MNTKDIKYLINIMEKSSLTALEIEEEGRKIRLERHTSVPEAQTSAPIAMTVPAIPTVPVEMEPPVEQPASPPEPEAEGKPIKSPMVGVFYASSAPEAEPYVQVGSRVKKGDVLCIIEAMKLMNEIIAEFDGEIAQVCAQNGNIVEYGETLFMMK